MEIGLISCRIYLSLDEQKTPQATPGNSRILKQASLNLKQNSFIINSSIHVVLT